jgi:hypothetical protein
MERDDAHMAAFKEKYLHEDYVQRRAAELYFQYVDLGVKWSACVQAVRTDWIPQFQVKWAEKARLSKELNK